MTEPASRVISEETTSAIREQSGGEKLQECQTCEQCLSTCFINDFYPGTDLPREVTRGVFSGDIQPIVDSEFLWACTLCARCTADCPKGIMMDHIIRMLRGVARAGGKGPKRLEDGLAMIRETGNSVGIDAEEFADTIQWLAEEAAGEIEGIDEEELTVPMDKHGAEYLFIPNPREYTSAAHMSSVYLRFLMATEVDWTYASTLCDISNWAYYLGDEETNLDLVRKIVETARSLGVKAILSTECGHGYKILKKDAEKMLGEPLGLEVTSVVDLAARLFTEGKLKLKQGAIDATVTYHDPCNLGRKLGMYEPPRELLRHIAREYVELEPHGKYALCCGGGGGVAQNSDLGKKKLEFGKAKADQIVASGAGIVTTSCQACLTQLHDIKEHYNLAVEARSLIELVVESLVR